MTETAREKFHIGMKVHTTALAYNENIVRERKYGVVVGFGTISPLMVRVVKDGTRTPEAWHMDFWTEDRKR